MRRWRKTDNSLKSEASITLVSLDGVKPEPPLTGRGSTIGGVKSAGDGATERRGAVKYI